MSDWLLAGVWRLVLRLPPGIGQKRVGQFVERARQEVGAVSARQRAVHHFVVRELPRYGRPIPPGHIAEEMGVSLATVNEILADLEARKGFVFRDEDGAVVRVGGGGGGADDESARGGRDRGVPGDGADATEGTRPRGGREARARSGEGDRRHASRNDRRGASGRARVGGQSWGRRSTK